jgi:hypothetical protein
VLFILNPFRILDVLLQDQEYSFQSSEGCEMKNPDALKLMKNHQDSSSLVKSHGHMLLNAWKDWIRVFIKL